MAVQVHTHTALVAYMSRLAHLTLRPTLHPTAEHRDAKYSFQLTGYPSPAVVLPLHGASGCVSAQRCTLKGRSLVLDQCT